MLIDYLIWCGKTQIYGMIIPLLVFVEWKTGVCEKLGDFVHNEIDYLVATRNDWP